MANEFPPTIYVNGATFPKCVGRTVRLIGRVLGVAPGKANIESSDNKTITVLRPNDAAPYQTEYVSITGVVQRDLTLSEGTFENFGSNLDLPNVNKFIEFSTKTPALFHLP